MSSNYHVELTPSDAGLKDRYVVQELIKEMAKSRPLDVASFVMGGQQGGGGGSNTGEMREMTSSGSQGYRLSTLVVSFVKPDGFANSSCRDESDLSHCERRACR